MPSRAKNTGGRGQFNSTARQLTIKCLSIFIVAVVATTASASTIRMFESAQVSAHVSFLDSIGRGVALIGGSNEIEVSDRSVTATWSPEYPFLELEEMSWSFGEVTYEGSWTATSDVTYQPVELHATVAFHPRPQRWSIPGSGGRDSGDP